MKRLLFPDGNPSNLLKRVATLSALPLFIMINESLNPYRWNLTHFFQTDSYVPSIEKMLILF